MKIHIHCPGTINDGLDSPSRGEGRWGQNLTRVLAEAGHEIVATGGGLPNWGSTKPVSNVFLIPEMLSSEEITRRFGPFDISMDPAWWENKTPAVIAKKYFVLKWSMEDYTRVKPLPENQFLCYPLNMNASQFYEDACVNKKRTFFLPLPLGKSFSPPNFKETGILWTCKDIDREKYMRDNAKVMMEDVLYPTLEKDKDLFVIWLMLDNMRKHGLNPNVRSEDVAINDLVPYFHVRGMLSVCRLVMSINIPGSVLDAASLGVPTLEWEEGGFFKDIGRKHNALIERGATKERITEIVHRYLYDKDFYSAYVKDIQNELRFNTNDNSVRCFNGIVEKIF